MEVTKCKSFKMTNNKMEFDPSSSFVTIKATNLISHQETL